MNSGFERQSLLRRMIVGVSGQAASRVTIALIALVWPSLMLKSWGVEGYGEWIALTSLAAFLSYTDFGLVTPTVYEVVMAASAKDYDRARHHVERSIMMVVIFMLPLLAIPAIGLSLVDFAARFNFHFIDNATGALIVGISAFAVLARTLRSLITAMLYANGDYGLVYGCGAAARVFEFLSVSAFLFFLDASPLLVAIVSAGAAAAEAMLIGHFAKRRVVWCSFRPRRFDFAWLKSIGRPVIGFALSNFATQGLMLQGPRIALSFIDGGAAVAVYALYGTMMRLVDQCVLIFIQPLEVEIAHSAGQNDTPRAASLVRTGTQTSWAVFLVIAVGLATIGPFLFPVWTQDKVPFEYSLFCLGALMFGGNQLGRVCTHALIATNRLYGPSFRVLAWALFSIALGSFLAWLYGVRGMFVGGVVGEFGLSLIVTSAVSTWLGYPLRGLLFDLSTLKHAVKIVHDRLARTLRF